MILTQLKPFDEIASSLEGEKRLFLLGCKGCAEASGTGGIEQVLEVKGRLESAGKEVAGHAVIDFLCQKALVKSRLRPKAGEILKADSVLVLACGIGTQAVAGAVAKPCHPGCNTLYLGEVRGEWMGTERCRECGDCLLDVTGGICPLTSCAKSLLNGPCGGAREGMCEVDRERECGWELIYTRLKLLGRLDRLYRFIPPKDYSKMNAPASLQRSSRWSVDRRVT